jgi:hypothetical protein
VRLVAAGAAPVAAESPRGAALREAAVRAAVADAVARAGAELVRDAGGEGDPSAVAAALGEDPLGYAASYRVVEDRGVGPARLLAGEGVPREYAVIVEAVVDLERVRAELVEAGLLAAAPLAAAHDRVAILLEGLDAYPDYRRVLDALAAQASAVRPLEFERGRVLVEAEGLRSPDLLVGRLRSELGGAYAVEDLPGEGGALRLRVRALGTGGSEAAPGAPQPPAGD